MFLRHLAHEAGDDPMETGAFVAKALLPCAQSPEILCKQKTMFGVNCKSYTQKQLHSTSMHQKVSKSHCTH